MGSYSLLQNTININAETYSSENFRSAAHISTDATFGRQHLLDMNQNPCSSMKTTTTLDNDKGKEATSMRNKASEDSQHSQNQAEDAILEAFNSNTMETIYNNSSQINEEVNKMFSSGDFQISQGLGEPLENILTVGRAAEINTRQIDPALPSSDQRPNLNDDSSARKRSKKRSLIETEAILEEARERSLVLDSGGRTSLYRGVTRHRWTGRFEAHLWDNSEKRAGQSRKGRQVYLGGYDSEEKAARAFDLASLRFWGPSTPTNFPVASYEREIEEMQCKGKYEYVTILRRRSSGFSRGASTYRGVTRHHQNGRWQARIGRVAGNKDLYLGTYETQEEAAEAYDIATIKYRGQTAVTNFDISRYDVPKIMSTPLPVGGLAKRMRMEEASAEITVDVDPQDEDESTVSSKGDSAISMSGNAFSASTETNGVPYQQEENPRMTSYQGGHLPNEAHIFNFPSQLHPANYEKYLQLQSMLASNGQFQYNLMALNPAAINTGNNRLPPPVIYKNMSGNPSASNGLMSLDYSFVPSNTSLDYSFVPSNTLPSATGNPYAHLFNANLNGTAGLMPEGTENMFERFSGHSGPHGFETQMANAQQDGTFCSGFRTQGCMK